MKSKYINIDLKVEMPDLEIVEYSIHARIDYFIDRNYGADTDNMRGEARTLVDDVEIIEILENGKVVELDEDEALEIKARIEDKFLEGSC